MPGGKIELLGTGIDPSRAQNLKVYFGHARAQVTRASSESISVIVPGNITSSAVRVEIDGTTSDIFHASVAGLIADNLHPVGNPAYDGEGRLFVTFSGTRGQKVPVSLFRIGRDGKVEPFLGEIANPTGLAVASDGVLYVSSRQDGNVYRVRPDRQVQLVASDLGIATGLAFDREGNLYVGDRRGTIFRIGPNGRRRSFCHLPSSVAAFHLAFDAESNLFVSAPTLSSVDSIYRISPKGEVDVFCSGLGRPQGMAFDVDGNLYVTEALVGASGVHRFRPDRSREYVVASPPLAGLAFDGRGGLALAGTSAVFHLGIGIQGQPLF